MHIGLRDLILLIHIDESKSLTRAAERSHLSLPAVSARVKELENQTGVRLLYRTSRGVAPTPAGLNLLKHARIIMNQIEHMKSDLQGFGEGIQGNIRIFANTTAVTEFMPEVLAKFLVTYPKVNVDLQERPTVEIIRGVLDGTADLGIAAGEMNVGGLEKRTFSYDRLVLALPPDHFLTQTEKVTFSEIMEYDYIGLYEGSTLQDFVNRLMKNSRSRLHIRVKVNNFQSICRMVEAGVGISIVPASAAHYHQKTMKIVTRDLDEEWALRERHILSRRGDALPSFTAELIDSIMKYPGHAKSKRLARRR